MGYEAVLAVLDVVVGDVLQAVQIVTLSPKAVYLTGNGNG